MLPDIYLHMIVLALASGRIAYCVTNDDLFEPLRQKLMLRDLEKHGDQGPYDGQGFLYSVMSCPFCLTAWTSVAFVGAYLAAADATVLAAAPFAVWAVANAYAKWLHS